MGNSIGGAQWRALTLFELLSDRTDVQLWTESPLNPELAGRYPVRQITPHQFPRGGNLLFIGAYYRIGLWPEKTKPRRIILIFNSPVISDLDNFVTGIGRVCQKDVEVCFASDGIRKMTGRDGPIHVSPINRERFKPNSNRREPFTVGRMGRNDWSKSHPDDPRFFASLLDLGFRVRIMGCQAQEWGMSAHPQLELLAMNQEAPEDFLNTLHAFHYRSHPDWYETFGRAVLESMCCGVPAVAEGRHGYTDYLRHGEGGFLFDDADEALNQLVALRTDTELWAAQSAMALRASERALDPRDMEEMLEFYCQ